MPLRLEDGDVTLPPGVRASLKAFFDADWHLLFLSPTLGGMSAPPSISWAASELLMGANAGAMFYTAGPFFARIAEALVTARAARPLDRAMGRARSGAGPWS